MGNFLGILPKTNSVGESKKFVDETLVHKFPGLSNRSSPRIPFPHGSLFLRIRSILKQSSQRAPNLPQHHRELQRFRERNQGNQQAAAGIRTVGGQQDYSHSEMARSIERLADEVARMRSDKELDRRELEDELRLF